MKQIINHKRYDTETAREIAFWQFGNRGDFSFEMETLYLTGNGNFFLHCEGGANSSYSVSVGMSARGPGQTIKVMTDDEVYDWLEEHGKVEAIEEIFPDRIEDA